MIFYILKIIWNWIYYLNIYLVFKFLFSLIIDLLPFIFNRFKENELLKNCGHNTYVLITGSSEGIGFAYAKYFAEVGFNIILTGRKLEKLENSKSLILKNPKIKSGIVIKCIEIDFCNFENLNSYKNFINDLDGLDISILINNVGGSPNGNYEKINYKSWIDINILNCVPMINLQREFIPKFLNRNKKSIIINISSQGAKYPFPFHFTYSSSKNLNNYISKSLNKKINNNKIEILSVLPGIVLTSLFLNTVGKDTELNNFGSTSDDVVNGSIYNITFKSTCIGSLYHIIIHNILEFMYSYSRILGIYNKHLKLGIKFFREKEEEFKKSKLI